MTKKNSTYKIHVLQIGELKQAKTNTKHSLPQKLLTARQSKHYYSKTGLL